MTMRRTTPAQSSPARALRVLALAGLLLLGPGAAAAWAQQQGAASDQAPCVYDGREVPHGTQIGVLRCDDGRWVRAGR